MKDELKTSSGVNDASKSPIIGTFEGECADANITNLNGLDITREVWDNVFNSDTYRQGIDLGWYIGFLGHPKDPGCMDFRNACIVMTEGHIDDAGKVYGKFNLIDTPVGRTVKTFIDAGVTFGISVRGAGDIVDNSVDPETFVFRGFDLVSFPAFPESIPTFTEIAASTDLEVQSKYKKICASVESNIHDITSASAIEIIQSQFAKQSSTYEALEQRKQEISSSCSTETSEDLNLDKEKLASMTNLYLEAIESNKKLKQQIASISAAYQSEIVANRRKIAAIERITSSQIARMDQIVSSTELKARACVSASKRLKSSLETERNTNLKYIQKIDASRQELEGKNKVISSLRAKLSETVTAAQSNKKRSSNLDAKIDSLTRQVQASQQLLKQYQDAYLRLYSSAVGVDLKNITVTATTSVDELQQAISGNEHVSDVFTEPMPVDINDYNDDLVTL